MIDWGTFIVVAIASLVAAVIVVVLYSCGLRLLADSGDFLPRTKRLGAIACFVLCAGAVLYGVYLIVPIFH